MKVWKAWPERCKMFSVWLPVHTQKVTKLKPLEKLNRKFKKIQRFLQEKKFTDMTSQDVTAFLLLHFWLFWFNGSLDK